MVLENLDRLERERQYHNDRFEEETRTDQEKYYWALADCEKDWAGAIRKAARGTRCLDLGCALGDWSLRIAPLAERIDGIDISNIAIDKASKRAHENGLKNVFFSTMDAQATEFPNNTFDLVFGRGIIHHLDTEKSLKEIHRVLKPGGLAVFKEPLGSNIAINIYRRMTPGARTPDEHPLVPEDKRIAERIFSSVNWQYYGLCTLAAVPFRASALGGYIYRTTARVDRILGHIPGFRWQLWYALMSMTKKI